MSDNEIGYYQHGDVDEEHTSDGEGIDTGYNDVGANSDDDEEEDEEDDEEEARKVAEGFIVSDDEEEEEDSDGSQKVAVRRRKRKKIEDYDEELDEEDLDLLEENTGLKLSRREPKLKRLKRGRQNEPQIKETSVEKFFSDEEEGGYAQAEEEQLPDDTYPSQYRQRPIYDDMNDFIADEDEEAEDEQEDGYIREAPSRGRASKEMMGYLPEGFSEDVLADMFDIFGDGTDYDWALYDEEREEYNEQPEPKLADVFEPSELKDKMLTEEDDEVRLRDIPERMQIRYAGTQKNFEVVPSDEDVEAEAAWVFRELSYFKNITAPSDSLYDTVKSVVGFIVREYLEVPFISDHRRDYITEIDPTTGITTELLTKDDLWKIYDLDFKYQSFVNRKTTLRELIFKCNINDEYITSLLDKAESVEDVNDIFDYVNFKYSSNITALQKQAKGVKRPSSKSLFEQGLKNKVADLLPRFGISASQYGSNYLENARHYFPEDDLTNPEEEAEKYKGTTFSDANRVLEVSRYVIAGEIGHDPQVRKAMRRDWDTMAVVNVKPTTTGFPIIDDFHPLRPYKFLKNKPISSFTNGEFLQLLKGEADRLIEMSIEIPNESKWFDQIVEYYLSDGYSDAVQKWNEQRRGIIKESLDRYLRPIMQKHIREKLRIDAQETVCRASYLALMDKVNVGPFRGRDASQYKNGIPRVVTVSSGNGDFKDPVVAVCLNHRGKIVGNIEVSSLRDEKGWKQMVDFVTASKPNVVGVAGYSAQAHVVLKNMQRLVSEVNSTLDSTASPIDLVAVDDEASRLYKNSKRALEEFEDYPEVTRYCISLARRLQCPLLEYTGLGRDLMAIRFHKLQDFVPNDMRQMHLERALINVVNDMGVDINAASSNPYIASTLPYVCGLGPRKAQAILQKIEAKGELETRSELVTRGMTPAITFMNCASYLRIRGVDDADILDNTRIHPQEYDLARKMAGDALEIDEDDMDDYETKVTIVRRVVKEYPKKLNDLILDDYATVLREQYRAPKRQILEHIKLELQGPYHDRRNKYTRPTLDETFTMVTGETTDTLRQGFIVPVKIQTLRGKMANCVLDCGLEGVIYVDNASDSRVMNVSEVLRQGSTINAKVLHIDKEKFIVELSSKASETKPDSDIPLRRSPFDKYYSHEDEALAIKEQQAKRKKSVRVQRTINHPLFRPFNYLEAEDFLRNRQRGDLVIRPSSRGSDHIAITWKVDDDMFQHIDVLEIRKDSSVFASSKYKIGEQEFDDLDQLIVTYVEAIAAKAEELINHPKYRSGGTTALKTHLNALTMANPKMSAYGFCLSERPGYFELGFKLNAKSPPASWPVKVLPDGYRLRDTAYPLVSDLINGFKRIQANKAQQRRVQHSHGPVAHGHPHPHPHAYPHRHSYRPR
ncbi:SH2 domain-containing protein [Dichotomocladium elegans]|nr:SH2 domain-containing protein [Dichotomocladium elegans]